jgi:hypothetical protein
MAILEHEVVGAVQAAIITAQLVDSRDALLAGIDPQVVASLPQAPTLGQRILTDLAWLNDLGTLADEAVPLRTWLQNAITFAGPRREAAVFREALARCFVADRPSGFDGPMGASGAQGRDDPSAGGRRLRGASPQVTQQMLFELAQLRERSPDLQHWIDMFETAISDPGHGFTDSLIAEIGHIHLADCNSIRALDIFGPAAWSKPSAYRYLAQQIRRYLAANTSTDGWLVHMSAELSGAIKSGIQWALSHGLTESITKFDNVTDFRWIDETPMRLEFVRILLWTEEELLSPTAESVLAIHDTFNVPLFFRKTDANDPLRQTDFVLFGKPGHPPTGLKNSRRARRPEPVIRAEGASFASQFSTMLTERMPFASDARHVLESGGK